MSYSKKHIELKIKPVFFFAFLTIILINSCNKPLSFKWVYYDETVCADKWTNTNNNEVLKERVVDYLKSKSVKVYEIEIFLDRVPENCAACECKTGRRFKCKIGKKDLDDVKAQGFYE